jgi:hypothetical protein
MLEAEDVVTVSLYFIYDKNMGTGPYSWEGRIFSLILENMFRDCSTKICEPLVKGYY